MNIYTDNMSDGPNKDDILSKSDIVKTLWQNADYRAKQHNAHLGKIKSKISKEKESITIQGYKVIRFWEHDVERNFNECISFIKTECKI